MERWTFGVLESGIDPQGIGTLGMLLNLFATLALTGLFPPPTEKTQQLIDTIREPEYGGPGLEIEEAPSRWHPPAETEIDSHTVIAPQYPLIRHPS